MFNRLYLILTIKRAGSAAPDGGTHQCRSLLWDDRPKHSQLHSQSQSARQGRHRHLRVSRQQQPGLRQHDGPGEGGVPTRDRPGQPASVPVLGPATSHALLQRSVQASLMSTLCEDFIKTTTQNYHGSFSLYNYYLPLNKFLALLCISGGMNNS